MNAQKPKRVTLADVSAASGMSKASVSMILNDRPGSRLSAQAVDKVKAVAKELGYKPNAAARSLRVGKTGTLGFISDQVTVTRYASGMITGILRAAEQHDHTVLITETFGQPDGLAEAIAQLKHRDVDGLILGFMDSRLRDLKALPTGLPTVLVNSLEKSPSISVMPNEFKSGFDAVRRIEQSGASSVALIGPLRGAEADPLSYPSISRRFASLRTALAESEIELLGEWVLEDWNPADGYAATEKLLAGGPLPEAIICANDRVALGVFQALAEADRKPGTDLSVLSFDDEDIASYLRPQLTTLRLPYEEMGGRAVELLLESDSEPGEHLIDMPLVERASLRG